MDNAYRNGLPEQLAAPEARELMQAGAAVFDVRPAPECAAGMIAGATALDPGTIDQELAADGNIALICCTTGKRSLAVARKLRDRGVQGVASIEGGFRAWQALGYPCEFAAGLDAGSAERYARHLVLDGVGVAGQLAIRRSGVLLVGAGGLGSPAALYLAAAGIGRLGVVDDDQVERSNLQRQVLHSDDSVGCAKTESAKLRIQALNPDVDVRPQAVRLVAENVDSLLSGWDLVIDGSDNLATRYLVNEACLRLDIPMVYGGVSGFEGQVGVAHPGRGTGGHPCFRCVFPEPRGPVADCNVGGVLGVVPGVIGLLQATEAIKLILELGEPLVDRLLLWDALAMRFHSLKVSARPDCPACGT
jgi:molybdopterin/thiamine biosynthesis adenylyltransferase/rhodanese-related sulfurtransferase